MDETIKAYAAGLIDGEGSIYISRQLTTIRHKNPNYQLHFSLRMTTQKSVEFMRINFGGNYNVVKRQQENQKSLFHWSVASDKATEVLRLILPYLQLKKSQALLAIKFREEWQSQKGRGRKRSLPEEIEKRKLFWEQMRELNKKGV